MKINLQRIDNLLKPDHSYLEMVSICKFAVVLLSLSIFLQEAGAAISTCPKGQYLVRTHKRSGHYRSNGVYVSPTTVSTYCKNYRTYKPTELHFSKRKSHKGLSKSFSEDEKRKIRKIFKRLPPVLIKFGKITFHRQHFGKYLNNPAVANPDKKTIIIYDSISRHNMERVIAHELAHFVYDSLSKKERKAYETAAGWRRRKYKGKERNIFMRKSFVAMDSMLSPSEDFANNIEYYLYDEKTLKKKNPSIYKWVKRFMEESKK